MSAPVRKRVDVTFAGDDDVLQHISSITIAKAASSKKKSILSSSVQGGKKSSRKTVSYADDVDTADNGDLVGDVDVFKPSEVLSEEVDGYAGKEVFGFRTPKKSGQMAQKASESGTKTPTASASKSSAAKSKTPKSTSKKTPTAAKKSNKTPTKIPSKKVQGNKSNGQDTAEELRKIEATTPYRLRKRNILNLGDAISSSDSDMSSDDDTDSIASSESSASTSAKSASKKSKGELDVDNMAEDYFLAHSSNKVTTSDRTLARLENRLDQETVNVMLDSTAVTYKKEYDKIYKEHKSMFHKWMFNMCNGFNLLLHGFGSKRKLIEDFIKTMLKDFTHVVVNGYFPSITIKNILNSITEEIMDHSGTFRSVSDQIEFIRSHYESQDEEDVFLIIHNIDGAMLRGEKVQSALSQLAQIPGFHIVASADHINAPLLWDQAKTCRFNWLWYDVTTYQPYLEETSYENSLLVQQSGALALSSLTHVMHSLTPNARGIFMLLVQYQMDSKDNPSYFGMSFQDLYQKCREAFLVNSDLTLRAQLTEFKDHKLIRFKKAIDGVEYLIIPLDNSTLKDFLDQQEI